ncbi:endonuclease NucS [Haloparvum sp. AD34]
MTVTTLHDPSHREALWELESAFDRGDLITVFGRCTVDYDGRASSELGPGARLVILKPDGAALVHTDEGRTPVNWQPPGSEHHAAVRDGQLRIRSERTNPSESLTVQFSAVDELSAMAVTGGRDLDLHGSEADLKRRVLDRPELVEPGFEPRETERESSAGPMDVFGVDGEGRPTVVELKRRRVGPSAANQLSRYVAALQRELGEDVAVRGVLVAPSVTDRAAELLAEEGFDHVALDPVTVEGDDEPAEGDEDDVAGDDPDADRDGVRNGPVDDGQESAAVGPVESGGSDA